MAHAHREGTVRDRLAVRTRLRRAAARAGDGVTCTCCGSSFGAFETTSRPNRRCWDCGSLERHRSLALYLDDSELVRPGMSILHIAPERALRSRLAPEGVDYLRGDLNPDRADVTVDVTDMPFADGSFDAVVCNHVLEHVPDDRRAMAEIFRALRPGGWALLMVPDLWLGAGRRETTDEDPSVTDPDERTRRFGQFDHVRRYGWDYVGRLESAGFAVEVVDMASRLSDDAITRHRLRKPDEVEPIVLARRA